MAKTQFSCIQCAYTSFKWLGCCPQCKQWHTFEEQNQQPSKAGKTAQSSGASTSNKLYTSSAIPTINTPRLVSSITEWDRVTGGGLVPGSFTIITGDPGIGKSTLLLQICHSLAKKDQPVVYVSAEESLTQVKLRCTRLGIENEDLYFSDCSDLETIIQLGKQKKPAVLILDSIQSIYSNDASQLPGTIGQLKDAAFKLMHFAKQTNTCVITTGHITKDGTLAGPKLLEHMVDTVLYLQKDAHWNIRLLRTIKNRFGPIHEVGFFHMQTDGLQEIGNINQHFLQQREEAPGSTLISIFEGSRPLLVEMQALVAQAQFNIPQRVVTGIDHKQVVLIAAILEKHLGCKMSQHDIFFKISTGMKIKEQDADLGIALALLSSYFGQALPAKTLVLGQISVTGQVTPIQNIQAHLQEAQTFGFSQVIVSAKQTLEKTKLKIKRVRNVYELLPLFPEQ